MSAVQPEPEHTKIEIVGEINTSILYANFAKVIVTPFDAIITFACVDPATALGDEAADAPASSVHAPAVARIALPHLVLEGLEKAIHDQIEKQAQRQASSEEG